MQDNELTELLTQIRAKRGYLLPHHGLMAVSSPELLDAYDELYSTIALTERQLSSRAHEFVWLGVLIATSEVLGTHHIKRFHDAGGTDAEFAAAMTLTALVKGCDAYHFVDDHWLPHLPEFSPRDEYLNAFRNLADMLAATPLPLAHITACAVHTCLANWAGLRWQIIAAYEDGLNELELAEALSVAMFPGSVPNYVEAAGVWRQVILADEVDASDVFKKWAELSGQGGYDEASGLTGKQP
jgi:alkylhydroperoxidase/carboxymuconolactone decarboxylase family protein YurZ